MIKELKEFVMPYYQKKDMMHDFSHIEKIIKLSKILAKDYDVDIELIIICVYLHGVVHKDEKGIIDFLISKKVNKERIKKIIQVSWDSQKDQTSNILEGKILHDAHLLEGGKTYIITKSLISGTLKGQTLAKTIRYIEDNIIGKFKCELPECQKVYELKEMYAKDYIKDLKEHLIID